MDNNRMSGIAQLLQRGIVVKAPVNCTVRDFLNGQLKLSADYVENRISTILLNGKPVDNIDKATLKDGDTLALSAAMPGLVGTTLRKGSFYAAMRDGITYHETRETDLQCEGMITLKLFNMVASELEPFLLEDGIWVRKEHLDDFLQSRPADFLTHCGLAVTGAEGATPDIFPEIVCSDKNRLVRLKSQCFGKNLFSNI
jgi:hypothetical protein